MFCAAAGAATSASSAVAMSAFMSGPLTCPGARRRTAAARMRMRALTRLPWSPSNSRHSCATPKRSSSSCIQVSSRSRKSLSPTSMRIASRPFIAGTYCGSITSGELAWSRAITQRIDRAVLDPGVEIVRRVLRVGRHRGKRRRGDQREPRPRGDLLGRSAPATACSCSAVMSAATGSTAPSRRCSRTPRVLHRDLERAVAAHRMAREAAARGSAIVR